MQRQEQRACAWRAPIVRLVAAMLASAGLAACGDSPGTVTVGPSPGWTPPAVQASVTQRSPASSFTTFGCSGVTDLSLTFDVVIVALRPIRLDEVSIAMIDGTHLGGPSVPPLWASTTRPDSVFMSAGTIRTVTLHPKVRCDQLFPLGVSARVAFVDDQGTGSVTVGGSIE